MAGPTSLPGLPMHSGHTPRCVSQHCLEGTPVDTYNLGLGTKEHDLHRIRRASLNPFFSKRSVSELVPSILPIIDGLCGRFNEASKTGGPVDLKYCYSALTLDIMNEYCFSTDPHTVAKPDFGRKNFDAIDSFLEISLIVCDKMHDLRDIALTLFLEHPYPMAYEIALLFTGRKYHNHFQYGFQPSLKDWFMRIINPAMRDILDMRDVRSPYS
jgi:hypothetical protein